MKFLQAEKLQVDISYDLPASKYSLIIQVTSLNYQQINCNKYHSIFVPNIFHYASHSKCLLKITTGYIAGYRTNSVVSDEAYFWSILNLVYTVSRQHNLDLLLNYFL